MQETPRLIFEKQNLRSVRAKQISFNVFVVCVVVVISIFSWWKLKQDQNFHLQQSIRTANSMFSSYLDHDLTINTQPLDSMAKRWEMRAGTPKTEWQLDAASIVNNYPSIQAVEWADNAGVVQWIVPENANENMVGVSLHAEQRRRTALQEVFETKQPRFSHIVDLVQGGKGFLYYVPLFNMGKFDGVIISVYRLDTFIKNLFSLHEYDKFNINIYANGKRILQDINNQQVDPKFTHSLIFKKNNIHWQLELTPSIAYVKSNQSSLPLMVLLSGLIFAATLYLILTLLNTARRKTIDSIRSSQQLNMTYQTIRTIAETNQFDEAIRSVLSFICQETHWPMGHAYLPNKNKSALVSSGFWYIDPNQRLALNDFVDITKKTTFELGVGLPGRVWQSKEPIWIYDIHTSSNFPRAKLCPTIDLHSAFAFPVLDNAGDVVVILEFFTHEKIPQAQSFMHYLQTLSIQLSSAIDRLAMEDKVRISEMKYRNVIEGAGNAIIMMDFQGKILECNQATDVLFGRNEVTMVGEKLSTLLSPPHDEELARYIETYLDTGIQGPIGQGEEIIIIDKNMNPLSIFISISEIELEGDVYFIAMLQDMSSQKHTEKALKSSQARELMLHYIADGLYGVDRQGRITFANPAALTLLDYTETEILNKDMHALFHHSHPDGSQYKSTDCPMKTALLQGKPYHTDDVVFWNKAKAPVHVSYTSTPMRKDGKLIGSAITIKPVNSI